MIYIHIPFCESKCPYCAFNSYVSAKNQHSRYMDALLVQLKADLSRFDMCRAQSVYIGGGTPSAVDAALYAPLFQILAPLLAPDAEVTIEANPGSLTPRWAETMRRYGVNRLSLGVQSFDDEKLGVLGRVHSGDQARRALQTAQAAGFKAINLDLIYGVAGDTFKSLQADLSAAQTHGATHISAYMLTLEEETPFETRADLTLDDEPLLRRFAEAIEEAGYPRYEVAAFGQIPSRHNSGYWAGKEYLGVGAGATGTVGGVRYEPHKNPDRYITDPLFRTEEIIDENTWKTERIMLGLRCALGVEQNWLNAAQRARADRLVQEGRFVYQAGRYFNLDFFVADEAALYLLG